MDRDDIIQNVKAYGQRWPEEVDIAERFIAFLTSEPDAFNRERSAGHVTGSAWVVNRAGTQVLLTHHKKLGLWIQLGGHADGDSDVVRVARREAEEESGLMDLVQEDTGFFDIDVHRIPPYGREPEHFHWDFRTVFRAMGSHVFRLSEESHELRWINIRRLQELTHEESMLRMARKWLARSAPV
ncbi:MAG: NUDIX hydrolase [Kiritimatiellae bacterium]|jgi:8-oxo-dGTP pyrophosphatase MutT (NUDIX family)|nr:NUDIX hydrolase [Kiritimatiellia bacterium]MDD4341989.1 NUDIX hydrolase [Kiritimatiellia bacterium]MDY0150588.1 NUDIX hydrolase [Kiritimatiellia bacterium]